MDQPSSSLPGARGETSELTSRRFLNLCKQTATKLCLAFSDHTLYPHDHPACTSWR